MNDATDRGAAATSPGQRRTLRGDDARALILEQIKAHNNGLLAVLGRYEASDTTRKWHETIRAIEEFINVPLFGVDDENVVRGLLSVRLDGSFLQNPGAAWLSVKAALSPYLDPGTVDRFCRLMLQIAVIRSAFVLHGQSTFGYGITLDTVAEAMNYLQSRRRHFVALLHLMPRACQGTQKLAPLDALNVLLPQIEHSCVTITSLYLKLALADSLPDFTMEIDDVGGAASHWLETLDAGFLDPERASIIVMNELRGDQICVPTQEVVDPKKIFSAEELRNSIKLLGATYDAFGLNDSDFATIHPLSGRCRGGRETWRAVSTRRICAL